MCPSVRFTEVVGRELVCVCVCVGGGGYVCMCVGCGGIENKEIVSC